MSDINKVDLTRAAQLAELDDPYDLLALRLLFRALGEVLENERSDRTVVFPDPRRRALMELIWPERGR
ncbi:hypothetical protein KFJ24_15515 [Marinobacter sediminum]|uniref:hypothetical protein n=1 Tax=Marinobacter sediminum TaxID=256323 RepID=UPI00202E001B|nr:hypothetical protein [Marinobacter sediminum]MCM0613895.1 hypothetical protein [Marinobacter sediminum]